MDYKSATFNEFSHGQVHRLPHLQRVLQKHVDNAQGAEYMWWNNVETKPGAGYPLTWEDQERFKGGWEVTGGALRLKLLKGPGKIRTLANIFFQPNLPTIDDYYEPFTFDYQNLFNAPAGDDQPVAAPKSLLHRRVHGEDSPRTELGRRHGRIPAVRVQRPEPQGSFGAPEGDAHQVP